MIDREKVKEGLAACDTSACFCCPYDQNKSDRCHLNEEALALIEELEAEIERLNKER